MIYEFQMNIIEQPWIQGVEAIGEIFRSHSNFTLIFCIKVLKKVITIII
jgi:hypothetical protein